MIGLSNGYGFMFLYFSIIWSERRYVSQGSTGRFIIEQVREGKEPVNPACGSIKNALVTDLVLNTALFAFA